MRAKSIPRHLAALPYAFACLHLCLCVCVCKTRVLNLLQYHPVPKSITIHGQSSLQTP